MKNLIACIWIMSLIMTSAFMPIFSAENKKPTPAPATEADEDDEDETKDKIKNPSESAEDTLQKVRDSYYTIEKQGVTRYACFVKIPEIAKSRDFRNNFILTNVNYELIWERDKPVQVKARDLPAYFRPEAKFEAETYARMMQDAYQELSKITYPVQIFFKLLDSVDKTKLEITALPDGKLTRINITPKTKEKGSDTKKQEPQPLEPKDSPDPEQPNKEKTKSPTPLSNDESFSVAIWCNKDYQITKFETANKRENIFAIISPVKYKKLWNMGKLDITKKNAKNEFLERTLINYLYEYPKNIMIPSSIAITKVDKAGKPLERRNEPNPVTIQFNQYEIESNK
ncbi:MAG: hypothetical protein WC980_08600 [Candidatus Brocadiia bacterium]